MTTFYRAALNAGPSIAACPSICSSVRQTREFWQNERKISVDILYHTKDHLAYDHYDYY